MRHRAVILWGMFAGQLIVAAVAIGLCRPPPNPWLRYASLAILLAQFHLLGVWIGSGRRSIPWRLIAVAACLTGLTWLPGASTPFSVCVPGIFVSAAIFVVVRSFGYQLLEPERRLDTRLPSLRQFSLRSVLIWITVVAILLSLASMAHPVVLRRIQREPVLVLLVHFVVGSVCTAELSVLLAKRPSWIKGVFLYLTAMALVFPLTGEGRYLWFANLVMLWLAVSFLPLRMLGYRFGRARTSADEAVASSATDEEDTTARTELQADRGTAKESVIE